MTRTVHGEHGGSHSFQPLGGCPPQGLSNQSRIDAGVDGFDNAILPPAPADAPPLSTECGLDAIDAAADGPEVRMPRLVMSGRIDAAAARDVGSHGTGIQCRHGRDNIGDSKRPVVRVRKCRGRFKDLLMDAVHA